MTIKPTNYEKFHYTWNSIVDDEEPKKSQRIKKTEEFIVGYLLENDKSMFVLLKGEFQKINLNILKNSNKY